MSNGKGYVVIEGEKTPTKNQAKQKRHHPDAAHVVPFLQDVLYIVLPYSCRFIHCGIILFHRFLDPYFRFSLTIESDF